MRLLLILAASLGLTALGLLLTPAASLGLAALRLLLILAPSLRLTTLRLPLLLAPAILFVPVALGIRRISGPEQQQQQYSRADRSERSHELVLPLASCHTARLARRVSSCPRNRDRREVDRGSG